VAVSLTKDGAPDVLPNQITVKCPACGQPYRLCYSDDEWNRAKDWIRLAERALREDHKCRHELSSLAIAWKGNPQDGLALMYELRTMPAHPPLVRSLFFLSAKRSVAKIKPEI
jgi:hypothetical protein